jgi:hypothetical protein
VTRTTTGTVRVTESLAPAGRWWPEPGGWSSEPQHSLAAVYAGGMVRLGLSDLYQGMSHWQRLTTPHALANVTLSLAGAAGHRHCQCASAEDSLPVADSEGHMVTPPASGLSRTLSVATRSESNFKFESCSSCRILVVRNLLFAIFRFSSGCTFMTLFNKSSMKIIAGPSENIWFNQHFIITQAFTLDFKLILSFPCDSV